MRTAIAALDFLRDEWLAFGNRLLEFVGAADREERCALLPLLAANLVLSMNSPEGLRARRQATWRAPRRWPGDTNAREQAWLAATEAWLAGDARPQAQRSTSRWSPNGRATCSPASSGSFTPSSRGDAEALLRIGERMFAGQPRQPLRLGHACLRPRGVQSPRRGRGARAAARIDMRARAIRGRTTSLAHCLEARGRLLEGVAFLQSISDTWEGCNSFMYTHNWWHLALFLIDLDRTDEALALFDKRVWGVWKDFCEDQINAISLLARLELRGVDVGERWTDVAPYLEPRLHEHFVPFLDLQYLYGAGPRRQAERRHRDAGQPGGPRRAREAVRARGLGRLRRAGRARPRRPRHAATSPKPRACSARPCRTCSRSAAASRSARCSAPSISTP